MAKEIEWLDTGDVDFRIHAYSRRGPHRNLIARAGFRMFGRREQIAFVHSTLARMRRLTEAALRDGSVRDQAEQLTARRGFATAPAHAALAGAPRE